MYTSIYIYIYIYIYIRRVFQCNWNHDRSAYTITLLHSQTIPLQKRWFAAPMANRYLGGRNGAEAALDKCWHTRCKRWRRRVATRLSCSAADPDAMVSVVAVGTIVPRCHQGTTAL